MGSFAQLGQRLRQAFRARFGWYVLEDPRPIAASAPYTFFMPSEAEIASLRAGDHAKLMFRSVPSSLEWGGERMWVVVERVAKRNLSGVLANGPSDMPQLRAGARVRFKPYHVIDVILEGHAVVTDSTPKKDYWERCLVDDAVISGKLPVGYIYREIPDMAEQGDEYPDSGWRIRGQLAGASQREIDSRKVSYIALGPVLNKDDSWLHLIDSPIGVAFERGASGEWVQERWAETSETNLH